ncbi:MAG: hypothetical protein FIA99_07635 [Ruminiclostridium sp.]|nr:hypothetical protein [Ruminiclostridium sp.]
MQENNYYRQPQPFPGGMPGGFLGQFFGFPQMLPSGQPGGGSPFGMPGGGPPFGQPGGPPSGPPPSFVPSQTAAQQGVGILAINPGAIRPCRFRYVYLWLDNGQQFWAWLVFVGSRSVAGWRWLGFRWVYFGIDLDRIESFVCY